MVLSPYYTGLTGKAASRLPSVTEIILPYNSKNSISRMLFMKSPRLKLMDKINLKKKLKLLIVGK